MLILKNFIRQDGGVTAIEYALIAVFIAIIAVAAVTAIGTRLNTAYTNVQNALPAS
jgi:pilus assembly protein Flp/PilA